MYIHQSVARKCVEYLAELARYNYVTPKSYLELLNIFSVLIGQKKQELKTAKNRMKSGLDKVGQGGACEQWPTACGSACPILALTQGSSQCLNGWLPPLSKEKKQPAKGKTKAERSTDSQGAAPFL